MPPQSPVSAYFGSVSPRILVVDDEPLNVKALQELLMSWGCTVRSTQNGPEALATVPEFDPDLILLDILMPGPSGYEICKKLQADSATQHIPVIFLTSLGSDEHIVSGLETGARGYLTKPINRDELLAALHNWLAQKYRDDAHRPPKQRGTPKPA